MARVVCQALPRANRLTLLWSEGTATFAPFHLDEAAYAEFQRLARQAHQHLAQFGVVAGDPAAVAKAGYQLAQAGYALYKALFHLDRPIPGLARDVRDWLDDLTRQGAVERLEILGDTFTVPWSVLYDQVPDQAAFARPGGDAECWKGFWGRRYGLLGGRRVQWLRGRPFPEKPAVVLAVDSGYRAALPPEEQERLNAFQASHELILADSTANLARAFQSQEVDILCIFAKAQGNSIRLGNERLTAEMLEKIVYSSSGEEGPSGQTVVFLNTCPGDGEGGNVLSAFERFGGVGLLGTVQPIAAALANRCGLEILTGLLDGGLTLAAALAAIGQLHPLAAPLYFGCCPGGLRAGEPAELLPERDPLPLPDEPYPSLTPLEEADAPMLVGREFDVIQTATLLDESGTQLLLLHGRPGVGKSSLLRAGVVPYLEEDAVGYRFARQRAQEEEASDEQAYPLAAIRASSDLAGQLALALLEFCDRPYCYTTPTGNRVAVDLPALLASAIHKAPVTEDSAHSTNITGDQRAIAAGAGQGAPGSGHSLPTTEELRVALRHDHALLGRILVAVTAPLPFELVLLIEQGEELFSLVESDVEPHEGLGALAMLAEALTGPARAKVVMSLRTDYLGRLVDPLMQSPEDGHWVRTALVRELSEEELVEIIVQPTSQEALPGSDEVPQTKYDFRYEEGVPEQIAQNARRFAGANQASPLAIVEALCSRLYRLASRRPERVVRGLDLKFGGSDKAMTTYVASRINATCSGSDRKALRAILQKLLIRQPDGTLTRNLIFEQDLAVEWTGSAYFTQVLAGATRSDNHLLEVSYLNIGGKEGNHVSLGHDALVPAVAQQGEETAKRDFGWSKFSDALWIAIPLMILLAVFLGMKVRNSALALEAKEEKLKGLQELMEQNEPKLSGQRWPAYVGQLHAADQAIRAGDLVVARQALVSLKPINREAGDMRGFEWYYLWRQLNQNHATLYGHQGTVNAVALTADGFTMATASDDRTVRLWDGAASRELARFDLPVKSAAASGQCLAFSPNGGLLAAGCGDGVIRLWKVNRTGIDYLPSAAALAASLWNAELVPAWGVAQLAARSLPPSVASEADLADHKDAVTSVVFSPDGKLLASCGKDGAVKLWDMTQTPPKVSKTLGDHKSPVNAIAFAPDGALLASAAADKKVILWDAKNGEVKATLEGHSGEVTAVAWSDDGKTLATGGVEPGISVHFGTIRFWDLDGTTLKQRPSPAIATTPVFALAFTDGGKTLAAASKDNAIRFWDPATGQERTALRGHLGWVRSLAVAQGGAVVASGSFDGTARFWLPRQIERSDLLKVSSQPVAAVVFSPDDRWLATGSGDGVVKLWNAATGQEFKALTAHKGGVRALAWSGDGKSLISGGADGQLKLWDVDHASKSFGSELDAVAAHTKAVTSLEFPPKSKLLASGSRDGTAKVWKMEGGKFPKEPIVVDPKDDVLCLVFLPEVDFMATGHEDGKVRYWQPSLGKPLNMRQPVLTAHNRRITAMNMVWVPVERKKEVWLITAGEDQWIKYWKVGNPGPMYSMRGHGAPVTCMAISQENDQTLVTGSIDKTVKFWDPFAQEERWMLMPDHGAVGAVAISLDGRTVAAAGSDGMVRVFHGAR